MSVSKHIQQQLSQVKITMTYHFIPIKTAATKNNNNNNNNNMDTERERKEKTFLLLPKAKNRKKMLLKM